MTVNVSPQIEAKLFDVARQEGIDPAALIEKMVREYRPSVEPVTDHEARVQALLSEWQALDQTPLAPPVVTRNGETHSQALFRQWEEEDAAMTDEEKEAEDRLWEKFMKGVNETRAALGMRQL